MSELTGFLNEPSSTVAIFSNLVQVTNVDKKTQQSQLSDEVVTGTKSCQIKTGRLSPQPKALNSSMASDRAKLLQRSERLVEYNLTRRRRQQVKIRRGTKKQVMGLALAMLIRVITMQISISVYIFELKNIITMLIHKHI